MKDVKALITLRSGKKIEKPTSKPHVEEEEETKKGEVMKGKKKDVSEMKEDLVFFIYIYIYMHVIILIFKLRDLCFLYYYYYCMNFNSNSWFCMRFFYCDFRWRICM